MGERQGGGLKLDFDGRLRLQFRGAKITSDAGLLACRELDEALGLTEQAKDILAEARTGRNIQHDRGAVCGSRSSAVWPALRTLTTPNGWPRTRRCERLSAGGHPRGRPRVTAP